ncbi:MAG: CPBP family glutamic-type intramembrane protease [Candidatus Helarchaeota archaeon]
MYGNLDYFIIVAPITILAYFILKRLQKFDKPLLMIITLSVILFFVRFMLIFYSSSIGVMPYVYPNLLFYSLLSILGIVFSIIYVKKVLELDFKDIGWKFKNIKKNVIYGFLSYIPLIALFPLILYLVGLKISFNFTWDKIILGIEFGIILGGFYEETMFRGVIQKYFNSITTEKKSIIFTAITFTATHIGYLPFTGFGIYYIFVFIMALILSFLRYKLDLLACSILHGGIVFILIIFI